MQGKKEYRIVYPAGFKLVTFIIQRNYSKKTYQPRKINRLESTYQNRPENDKNQLRNINLLDKN